MIFFLVIDVLSFIIDESKDYLFPLYHLVRTNDCTSFFDFVQGIHD